MSKTTQKQPLTLKSFKRGDLVLAQLGVERRRATVVEVTRQFVRVRFSVDELPEEDHPTSIYKPDELELISE